jgi:O-antigen polymerase
MVNNQKQTIGLILLASVLLIAPFYTHLNIGGLGLNIPFNIASWTMATLFITFMILVMIRAKKICYSSLFNYFLVFPIIVIGVGLFSTDILQPIVWLFRQLYILGGLLFLLSLFQLNLKMIQIEQLLYWFVLAIFLHALVGLAQIKDMTVLLGWIPLSIERLPIGIFQQVNLQATYLVTGVIIILFLISRPSFTSTRLITKICFVITFCLTVYIIQASGSRTGIVTLIIATSLMFISRRKQLFRQKYFLLILLLITTFVILVGQSSGFSRVIDKTKKMTQEEQSFCNPPEK